MKKLLVAVFLFVVSPAWALTFKSDGSVVQKDGTVVTKTTQERYAEALSDYRAGRTVSGFPTAKKPGGLFGVLGAKSSSPSGFLVEILWKRVHRLFHCQAILTCPTPFLRLQKILA